MPETEPTTLATSKDRTDRLRAIPLLEAQCEAASPTLLLLLKDRDAAVRLAAAEALGRVGDLDAVQPLVEALVGPHTGGKGRWHTWLGLLSHLAVWPLAMALVMGPLPLQIAAGLGIAYFMLGPISHFTRRDEHKAFADAVSQALVGIAKRHPSGELAAVVPELRQSAGDRVMQSDDARAATKRAANYLERQAKELLTTPITAEAPEVEPAAVLPRPADSPEEELETLLHPTQPDHEQQQLHTGLE